MALDLAQLLAVSVYRAFDIDADGRILAGTDESGSVQLAEITPDGRQIPLTRLAGACTGRYLAGQRAVIVSHDDGGNERRQLSLLRLPLPDGRPAELADLVPLVADPRFIHTLADVQPGRICYLTNRRDGVAFDAVIRSLADGSERTITIGDRAIDEAQVSPDGRWLALSVPSAALANSGQILLLDLAGDGGTVTAVTPADELAMNGRLHWLPGSDGLVITSGHEREFTGVARYELAAGSWTWLVTDEAHDLAGWLSPDGRHLLVERNDDGASVLSLHEAATGQRLRDVPLPAAGCVTGGPLPEPCWSPDSRAVALSVSAAELPGDVIVVPAGPGTPRQLTSSARALGGAPAARPEPHQIPAAGGELVPCLVYRSAEPADPALSGSAVLVVHGGPEAQAKRGFDPYVQALAAAGHTVLVPNVRGSTGYGKRWYCADDGPRRMDSVADLAAIHRYLPKLGVDPARAALWGGSYGGYMVLAGLAFQPDLWAAGVDIVGISSLVTFLENTSAYRRAYREREYGTLAADREFLHAASPLTRIDQVRAPLFIIHGANDPRVPLSEAEQIHAALASRAQECELLVYGDEGHGLAKRANRADAVPKAVAFLARHLAA
ncbi:MAG: S9 family peptidase [Streptosporangiaceae bacterium]|jgi:dipeptidyl aminopeptidase/acylaminoacyl peptidase|nr:S9 family peptidase [Actinomycetota bacterium]